MKRVVIDPGTGPLRDALAAAQLAFEQETDPGGQEWILPDGSYTIDGDPTLQLGRAGHDLTLRGGSDTGLRLASVSLRLVGARVALAGLAIRSTGTNRPVDLDGDYVCAEGLRIRADGGAGAITALRLRASGALRAVDLDLGPVRTAGSPARALHLEGAGSVAVSDVAIRRVRAGAKATALDVGGDGARGLVRIGSVRIGGVRAERAVGAHLFSGASMDLARITVDSVRGGDKSNGLAVGLAATSDGTLDAVELTARRVSGFGASGLRLATGRGVTRDGHLAALDLTAEDIRCPGPPPQPVSTLFLATGITALAAGPLRLRGLTCQRIAGEGAVGVLGFGGGGVEVFVGRVEELAARSTSAAIGALLLADNSVRSVRASDLAIEGIGGGRNVADFAPHRRWAELARAFADRLHGTAPDALTWPDPDADGLSPRLFYQGTCGLAVLTPWRDPASPVVNPALEPLEAHDLVLRRIDGTALVAHGGQRPTGIRRAEIWAARAAGWIGADDARLAEATVHQVERGFELGPGHFEFYDCLFTRVGTSEPWISGGQAEVVTVRAVHSDGGGAPLERLHDLPYRDPGPAGDLLDLLPPAAPAPPDLRLRSTSGLHEEAVEVPGPRTSEPFVGAHPPERPPRCSVHDPRPRDWKPWTPPPGAVPIADTKARDARAFLQLMLDRALVTMPTWSERGPADMTRMVMELLADRLDHLSLQQEIATAEGWLETARLRRSVEDHARMLDHPVDPGLSASVMLRFSLDEAALVAMKSALGLQDELSAVSGPLERADADLSELLTGDADVITVPAGTLVSHGLALGESPIPGRDPESDDQVVFATDANLHLSVALDELLLETDVEPGETTALLDRRVEELRPGRWLVLYRGPRFGGMPVRVTRVEPGISTTRIHWDPRRPADVRYPTVESAPPGTHTRVLGNVVPATHGVPVHADGLAGALSNAVVRSWGDALRMEVDGRRTSELLLPFEPVSVHAPGHPLPGRDARSGAPRIEVSVDGDPWRLVDDLVAAGPTEEVFTLRPGQGGGTVVRFGDGVNGAALPARPVIVELALTHGKGALGNVGADVLDLILSVPSEVPPDSELALTRRLGELLPAWADGAGPPVDREGAVRAPSRSVVELVTAWGSKLVEAEGVTEAGEAAAEAGREAIRGGQAAEALLSVTNPLPAVGGRDPESIADIKRRAPRGVRVPLTAVAPADYVRLVEAMPEVLAARAQPVDRGLRHTIRVTVLLRDEDTLDRDERLHRWSLVRERLEAIRHLGFDVETAPPIWVPLDIDLAVDAAAHARAAAVHDDVVEALAGNGGLFDPDRVGLGGDVHLDAVYRAVLAVEGVEGVRVLRFRRLERDAPELLEVGVIAIGDHEVATIRGPHRPESNGVATVTVCGGMR